MNASALGNLSSFEVFFTNNLLHILEKIFFSLDYKSFKTCIGVSKVWQGLLRSDSFLEKGRAVFHKEILKDGVELELAAKEGDKDKVVAILSTKMFDFNNHVSNPMDRWTPLIQASNHGHRDIVQLLLWSGAHLNTQDKNGLSPLHHAASKGHRDIVKLLFESGAHLNAPDGSGLTPLHHAASKRETNTVQLLLSLGAEPDLTKAVKQGQYDILRELLQAGADPNMTILTGEFPLQYASLMGNKRVVQLLLLRGAYPRKQNKFGNTPLHWAASYGHKHVVKQLIDGGAELNSTNIWGRTPLYHAVKNGRKDVVKLLMDMGADQNIAEEGGKTPLTLAREKNDLYIINVLTGRHNLNLLIRDFLPTARDRLLEFSHAHPRAFIGILVCLLLLPMALIIGLVQLGLQPYPQHHNGTALMNFQVIVFNNYNGTDSGYIRPVWPYSGYDNVVELLLNSTNAEVNNDSGSYQLAIAAKNGTEIVAELLLHRPDVDVRKRGQHAPDVEIQNE